MRQPSAPAAQQPAQEVPMSPGDEAPQGTPGRRYVEAVAAQGGTVSGVHVPCARAPAESQWASGAHSFEAKGARCALSSGGQPPRTPRMINAASSFVLDASAA